MANSTWLRNPILPPTDKRWNPLASGKEARPTQEAIAAVAKVEHTCYSAAIAMFRTSHYTIALKAGRTFKKPRNLALENEPCSATSLRVSMLPILSVTCPPDLWLRQCDLWLRQCARMETSIKAQSYPGHFGTSLSTSHCRWGIITGSRMRPIQLTL